MNQVDQQLRYSLLYYPPLPSNRKQIVQYLKNTPCVGHQRDGVEFGSLHLKRQKYLVLGR